MTIASILCNLVDVQEKAAFWEETAHAVHLQFYNSVLIMLNMLLSKVKSHCQFFMQNGVSISG